MKNLMMKLSVTALVGFFTINCEPPSLPATRLEKKPDIQEPQAAPESEEAPDVDQEDIAINSNNDEQNNSQNMSGPVVNVYNSNTNVNNNDTNVDVQNQIISNLQQQIEFLNAQLNTCINAHVNVVKKHKHKHKHNHKKDCDEAQPAPQPQPEPTPVPSLDDVLMNLTLKQADLQASEQLNFSPARPLVIPSIILIDNKSNLHAPGNTAGTLTFVKADNAVVTCSYKFKSTYLFLKECSDDMEAGNVVNSASVTLQVSVKKASKADVKFSVYLYKN